MNKMCIIGNLTKDPELRVTRSGKDICTFTVAVNRKKRGEEITTFYRVSAFDNYAENCGKFLGKGSKVYVEGELDVDLYDGNDGQKKVSLEITAKFIEFVTIKKDDGSGTSDGGYASTSPQSVNSGTPAVHQMAYTEVQTDELPF